MMLSPGSTTAASLHAGTPSNSISPAGLPLFRDPSVISEPVAHSGLPPRQLLRRESSGQSEERSTGTPPDSSDAVLLRCRHTIERLHEEAEAERHRSLELHRRVVALEAELQAKHSSLEQERKQRLEVEALSTRLERRAAEAEARLTLLQHDRDEAARFQSAAASEDSRRRQAQEVQQLSEECRKLLERLADREAETVRLQRQVEQLSRGEEAEREEHERRLLAEAQKWEESCARLESQVQLEAARVQESLRRDLTTAGAELAECKAERERGRAELRRTGLRLEDTEVELERSQQELSQVRSEARSEAQAADRELERGRAALLREEEQARQLQEALRRSEDEARRRADDARALGDMLSQAQQHVAELEASRREAEKLTASASLRATEAEAELRASASWEGKVDRLRQKYRQNMAKMYRHLSEREAYERRLKQYIQCEVGVLRQYGREMEDYWRGRGDVRHAGLAIPAPPARLPRPWRDDAEAEGEAEDEWRESDHEWDEDDWPPRPTRRTASVGRASAGPSGRAQHWLRGRADDLDMSREAPWDGYADASEWERPF